ncbi:MAG: hypothetical protein AUJ52_12860 [Elusimicrobia bacterium CG1_02_63_36]|nr:MAG: hypothetical protein AUJ52_12860 [Elusimicrobia bacterium CG1_02_63_36]PIP82700.1 MAG: GNAT family N-acetyltransferase [Elusimicrobia bacterium CG22_combo_CG10-13_8_21_14_all_63_91]PJA11943.1 MAG: GNAT family N-acetyltransferase [Elusimicrobia bacterium CG_4_10_14_0_2_um_filter_63_34]PJB23812.1 MAG: GNAT family N-acetyltransferase [Elusimicrobia bacterium CG_4_9_14_3_um_filter_62_55]
MNVIIRAEKPTEREVSERILRAAFGREDEVRLSTALRGLSDFNPNLSLVGADENEIRGYALYHRSTVDTGTGSQPALLLSPIGVDPAYQRQGIGERLVRHGLERCRVVGLELVFVIGLPPYFSRFGFQPAAPLGLTPSIAIPEDQFQVIDLSGRMLGKIQGRVALPSPIAGGGQPVPTDS